MAIALTVLVIVAGAFVTAVVLRRRFGALGALVGGAAAGVALWAVASIGWLFWFANSN